MSYGKRRMSRERHTGARMRVKWWRILLLVPVLTATFSIATISHPQAAHASSCSGDSCNGQSAYWTGCYRVAYSVKQLDIVGPGNQVAMTLSIKYSPDCKAFYGQMDSY